jgi:hypothetical protein
MILLSKHRRAKFVLLPVDLWGLSLVLAILQVLVLVVSLGGGGCRVNAEKAETVLIHQQVPVGTVSSPMFGVIDGQGYLDFSAVSFDFSYSGSVRVTHSDVYPFLPEPVTLKMIGVTMDISQEPAFLDTSTNNDTTHLYLEQVLGIGAVDMDGHYHACCNDAARAAGVCTQANDEAVFFDGWNFSEWGSLILDPRQQTRYTTLHFEVLPD